MQQGAKIGLGKKFAENLETAFSSSHAREPVVDDGRFHGTDFRPFHLRVNREDIGKLFLSPLSLLKGEGGKTKNRGISKMLGEDSHIQSVRIS